MPAAWLLRLLRHDAALAAILALTSKATGRAIHQLLGASRPLTLTTSACGADGSWDGRQSHAYPPASVIHAWAPSAIALHITPQRARSPTSSPAAAAAYAQLLPPPLPPRAIGQRLTELQLAHVTLSDAMVVAWRMGRTMPALRRLELRNCGFFHAADPPAGGGGGSDQARRGARRALCARRDAEVVPPALEELHVTWDDPYTMVRCWWWWRDDGWLQRLAAAPGLRKLCVRQAWACMLPFRPDDGPEPQARAEGAAVVVAGPAAADVGGGGQSEEEGEEDDASSSSGGWDFPVFPRPAVQARMRRLQELRLHHVTGE